MSSEPRGLAQGWLPVLCVTPPRQWHSVVTVSILQFVSERPRQLEVLLTKDRFILGQLSQNRSRLQKATCAKLCISLHDEEGGIIK